MAGQIILEPSARPLKGTVDLPVSKSIANRLLVMSALSGGNIHIKQNNLPDDVRLMVEALTSESEEINLDNAGTGMRFLTAYFAVREGRTVVLDGNSAMRKRPIAPLVDALKSLGAEIDYNGDQGYPPIKITGKKLTGSTVQIPGDTSSQFISALMLIGSFLEKGLEINILEEKVSASYLWLTADLINEAGGKVEIVENNISISPTPELQPQLSIESDWSSASYFYAMAALRPSSEILLKGLRLTSSQGDKRIASVMNEFGISSKQDEKGVVIRSSSSAPTARFNYDLSSQPDLVQTLACFHAVRGDEVTFSGIDHLKFKETDRLVALQTELEKFGVEFSKTEIGWQQSGRAIWNGEAISTYGDHRMAMAFSLLSFSNSGLIIGNPEVVSKSYPDYWKQLASLT